ncbi:MAG TPA: ABC transporter permease [Vicinamibacterales bacterium]|nr:ABC transporter permease [Vicinamibacterales bacterium]
MDALRRLWTRWAEWRRPGTVEADLSAELQSHLDFLIDDHLRRGLSPAEARRAAQLDLGGLEQARALTRDARGFRVGDAFVSDVRLAIRHLRRTPGFTAAALAILALGIGANSAIFTVVDAVMLRPLPYTDPGRLVSVWEVMSEGLSAPGAAAQPAPPQRTAVAPANLADYAARVKSLSSMAAYSSLGFNLTGGGAPERVLGEEISANYFQTLGVSPAMGRTFSPDENTAGRDRVVIISHALWQSRFGGTPDVLGKTVRLGEPHEIVGVLPVGFVALSQPGAAEPVSVWVPMAFEPGVLTRRQEHLVQVVARLAPNASVESARAELAAVSDAMAREFPDMGTARGALAPVRADQITDVRTMLYVLLAAVALVLLVACVNVAGLLLVRALSRRREMAVRFALGATRNRMVFEQVVQSLVLATAGGMLGLLLGWATTRFLVAVAPASLPHIQDAGLDARVLVFTLVIVLITGLVFGAWPAMQAAKVDPVDALKDGERSVTSAWVVRRRATLLITEVALSAVLLVGALLMIRSLMALDRVDLGFDHSNVLAASVALSPAYGTPEARLKFFESLDAKLKQIPGVTATAFGNRFPLRGNLISGILLDSDPQYKQAGFQAVNPNYFATFGIPLKRGRALAEGDRNGAASVAVVNEAFGRVLLKGADPIGHVIRRGPAMPSITVVGVVGDVRRTGRTDETGTRAAEIVPQFYLPAAQTTLYPMALREVAVKMTAGAAGVPEAIRAVVLSIDPNQPVTAVRTLDASLAIGAAQKRFQTSLFVLFAFVAFGLAIVGVYGVIAYGVSQRSAEIALRLTLGATKTGIVLDIMRRTAIMVAAGVSAGLAVAFVTSRFVANLLFEIAPTDPVTYAIAAAGLLVAGVAAGGLAGLRATKVNPITALK